MNIAYFGSPEISQWLLEDLLKKNINIGLIITQPDKPAGKRLEMTPTAVNKFASEHNIDVFDRSLSKDNEADLIELLREKKIELGILFAYGEILSNKLLLCMKYGIWNIHPSLLPKYRGPAPIIFPLILGESQTGTTLMQMSEGLDQGDILKQDTLKIKAEYSRTIIERKLIDIAANQIDDALSLLKTNTLQSKQQESRFATYTKLLKKRDGFVSQEFISKALSNKKITFDYFPTIIRAYYNKNNIQALDRYDAGPILYHLYQGLHPWPGVWTTVQIDNTEKRLKILEVSIHNQTPQLRLVQLEGKKPVDFQTFKKSYNINLL